MLILSKTDLVPESSLDLLRERLAALASDVPVVLAVKGAIGAELLFPPEMKARRDARREAAPPPPPHSHEAFSSEVLEVEAGVDEETLRARLVELGVLRAKGFVQSAAGLKLVQGVGRRIEIIDPDREPPPEMVGQVVIIRRLEGHHHHHH